LFDRAFHYSLNRIKQNYVMYVNKLPAVVGVSCDIALFNSPLTFEIDIHTPYIMLCKKKFRDKFY